LKVLADLQVVMMKTDVQTRSNQSMHIPVNLRPLNRCNV